MNAVIVSVVVLQSVILLVLGVLVLGLLRSYATVLERLHRIDGGEEGGSTRAGQEFAAPPFQTVMGVPAPPGDAPTGSLPTSKRETWASAHDVVGQGLSGEVVSVRTIGVRHDTVLVFLSSGCTGCGEFWGELADRGREAMASGRLLIVTKGPDEESTGLLAQLCPPNLDLVMSSAAWADYQVPGSPYVVVVDGGSGRVKGEGSGTSLSQVSGLMRQAFGDLAPMTASRSIIKPRADTEREVDVDRTLLAAGIGPGHPSLYGPDASAAVEDRYRRLDLVDVADSPSHTHSRPEAGR